MAAASSKYRLTASWADSFAVSVTNRSLWGFTDLGREAEGVAGDVACVPHRSQAGRWRLDQQRYPVARDAQGALAPQPATRLVPRSHLGHQAVGGNAGHVAVPDAEGVVTLRRAERIECVVE